MKNIQIISKTYGIKNAIVDDEMFDYLNQWKWCLSRQGNVFYVVRRISKQKVLSMHTVVLKNESKLAIDHIDHNGLNNTKANLRLCDKSKNQMNSRSQKNSTSNYLGVSLHISRRDVNGKAYEYFKWAAKIHVNGKEKSLGTYVNEKDAAKAYNAAALKNFGEFANINIL